jgi:hypothetical protein
VREHPNGEGQWLIYILFGITMLLVPITLAKVFERWKKANAKHGTHPSLLLYTPSSVIAIPNIHHLYHVIFIEVLPL